MQTNHVSSPRQPEKNPNHCEQRFGPFFKPTPPKSDNQRCNPDLTLGRPRCNNFLRWQTLGNNLKTRRMTQDELIQAVWNKGTTIQNNDPAQWRKDTCGAWIARNQYGNRNSDYGWEIDHINPNGGDAIGNLQPLQWENNVAKSDGRQVCVVTAVGTKNAKKSSATAP